MSEHTGDVQVVDNPDQSRFEIHADGQLGGWVDYQSSSDGLVLTHTEVGERFRGRGLAGRVTRAALDSARDRGLEVTPLCPYVADYIRKHPEYLPIVDERHRHELTRPKSE